MTPVCSNTYCTFYLSVTLRRFHVRGSSSLQEIFQRQPGGKQPGEFSRETGIRAGLLCLCHFNEQGDEESPGQRALKRNSHLGSFTAPGFVLFKNRRC